jgi:hypothetical protein
LDLDQPVLPGKTLSTQFNIFVLRQAMEFSGLSGGCAARETAGHKRSLLLPL